MYIDQKGIALQIVLDSTTNPTVDFAVFGASVRSDETCNSSSSKLFSGIKMSSYLFTFLLLRSGKRVTPNSKLFFTTTNNGKKGFSSVLSHLPSAIAVFYVKGTQIYTW